MQKREQEKPKKNASLDAAAAAGRGDADAKEVGDALVGIDLVFNAGEAVAFVVVDFEDGGAALFLDGVGYLLGFGFGAARVVASGEDEQGSLHLVDEVDGGALMPESFVLDGVSHEEAVIFL